MATPVEKPLGFPKCAKCYWLKAGSAAECFGCAAKTLTRPKTALCPVCSQALPTGSSTCRNSVCGWSDREIGRVAAIATYTHPLDAAIKALKYNGQTGWALIFGRIVHGWLNANATPETFDLIVPNPTYAGPSTSARQHTERVIDAAAQDDLTRRWRFDHSPWALSKPAETPSSANKTWREKRDAAMAHANAIAVDTRRVHGKRVLIYDDVCTTLLQMEYLARRLKTEGAKSVNGLVLARLEYAS